MSFILGSGSRGWRDPEPIKRTMRAWYQPGDELVIGDAPDGLDPLLATMWLERTGDVPDVHRAKWEAFGRAAGHLRNEQMLALRRPRLGLVWMAGQTPGSQDMINQLREAGVPTIVHYWPETS